MKSLRLIVLAFALSAFAVACGGDKKKAEEPANTEQKDADSDKSDNTDTPTDTSPAEGDEFDSDPLPNLCKGKGN